MEEDIINEVKIKGSDFIQIDSYLYKVCKSICKIIISDKIGSGFLIKLYNGNKFIYCLMTNEYVINKEAIKSKKTIVIFLQ